MKKTLLTVLLLSMSLIVFAQEDPGDNPDVQVPIDGGVLAMAAAGAVYAVKKLKESKNQKRSSTVGE
jgi:hypothetical protein